MRARFQSYYTAQFGPDLEAIKAARISGATLEIEEVPYYSPSYSEITYLLGKQQVKKLIVNTRLPLAGWNTRFEIREGLIISPNYHEGSFSSEFAQKWLNATAVLTVEPGTFSPDLLYKTIPQTIWNAFLTQLPFQSIVKELDLSEHRHLWPAYNYSASSNDPRLQYWRASAFSQYHFLASYLDPVNEENCFPGESQKWKEAIDQGLIANGQMVDEAKKYFGPYATAEYLDKFSNYPLASKLTAVGDFIESRALPIHNHRAINPAKREEFIAYLPSSKTDPVNFEKMISDVNAIAKLGAGNAPVYGKILFHARNNFGLFKAKDLSKYSSCHYYFIEIYKDLIYPELLRVFFEIAGLDYEQYDKHDTKLNNLRASALNAFKVFLHDYLPIDELIRLTSEWRITRARTHSKMPAAMIRLEWHPLFIEPITINQVTFSCFVTEAELKKEGEEKHHCAGGWAPQCMLGHAHILRAQTSSGEYSTIWLYEPNGFEFTIMYNFKQKEEDPCEEILTASELFLEKINQERPKLKKMKLEELTKDSTFLNLQRGKIDASAEQMDNISEYYPHPLYDQESQEAIYQAYPQEHLPPMMRAANYRQMIEQLSNHFDLAECVGNALPQYDQRMLVESNKC